MGRNILDAMNNTRTRLGDPRAQAPNDSQLLQQVTSQIRTLLRAKQNVSVQWNYGETFVEITPNEDTYQITDAAFGTPLVVTTVPENPNQIVRIVPFYCPQNLEYSWGFSQNAGAWLGAVALDGSNCNAARCAIFWQNNLAYIRFIPAPVLSPATYKLAYLQNANSVTIDALTSTPLMDQDMDLVECRSAKSLLSTAEWYSSETKDGRTMNAEKRKDLMVTLSDDVTLAYEQFLIGNRISTGPHLYQRWSCTTE